MAGNSPGKRKLKEELSQSGFILTDIGIDFAICAFEVRVTHNRRAPVPGTGNVNHVEVVLLDDTVQMRIDEILSGSRPPVSEQHVLDICESQRPFQQRIVVQINLTDREVICGAPVRINLVEEVRSESVGFHK